MAIMAAGLGFLMFVFLITACSLLVGISRGAKESVSSERSIVSSAPESSLPQSNSGASKEQSSLTESTQPSEEESVQSSAQESSGKNEASTDNSSELSSPESSEEMVDGMRKSFVDSMNSYEAFFDEYIDFMTSFKKSPSTAEMIIQYAEFMQKYAEYMDSFEKVGNEDLNEKELNYYLEVQTRVSQKLLSASLTMATESSETSV